MLFTVIKKNNYQDSINLMLLTNEINTLEGVTKSQIMMGTEANKDIMNSAGLLSDEAKDAAPSDMVIAIEASEDSVVSRVVEKVNQFLSDLSVKKGSQVIKSATSMEMALEMLPDANVALFSIPGEYGAPEMEKALKKGLHVFSFTDNISVEDEVKLKKLAHEKGLLMMGPDCGTGIISSIPIAFTNVVRPGNIGIVGASGTGIQEVSTIIDRLGAGCVHAIGTGGRDLYEAINGVTMKDAILALEYHDATDVIVVISKPPSKSVRDEVVNLLQNLSKPVVAIFLGEHPKAHEGNVYFAHTLDEAARIAVDLSNNSTVASTYHTPVQTEAFATVSEDKTVKGLYSGGTLGSEAAMLISEALSLGGVIKAEGYLLKTNGFEVVDLGDDMYTQGKPHPMIDPEVRIAFMKKMADQPETGIILFDVVLGYGCHPDMVGALLPAIESIKSIRGNDIRFVATVVGTDQDPQDYHEAVRRLKQVGVFVADSNAKAVELALALKGVKLHENEKIKQHVDVRPIELNRPSDAVMKLITEKPKVINIGLESFTQSIRDFGGETVQYQWKPRAGGNKRMIKLLDAIETFETEIDENNLIVIEKLRMAQPFLVDVVSAKSVIPELNQDVKTLLHAGPPIQFAVMTGPMQGSCIGAILFEGWATDEASARNLLENNEIRFIPCHHVGAVGPMGGITSSNMPVVVVENRLDGTQAFCTLNEGIGKVLRFGAYSKEVVDRLLWMKNTLGPTLSEAIKMMPEGLNLNVLIAKAITMGDEFHQRNIAASLIFLKEVAPYIVMLNKSEKDKQSVMKFLADTDQFFLNIMMATSKSMVDVARKHQKGTVVTTMTRNGRQFGIRISGMGDEWFTAPVNTPKGLYFTGYTEADGNPDIGDSAITETVGVGGMAMIAAPGVTRFVGAGGFEDALAISEEMNQICISNNPNFSIPTWDFKGACLGIDIRKVIETGITPLINTGIAHREAGVGQVGAGTVRAPLACFEKALEAYAQSLGLTV